MTHWILAHWGWMLLGWCALSLVFCACWSFWRRRVDHEPPQRRYRRMRERALEGLHLESRAPVWPAKNDFGEDWP